ncbi:MAG TPA: hypothetical protein VD994_09575 [Prosthecobacter sp.]|nr:hypothetical protein [Prosthecobacter sp.]
MKSASKKMSRRLQKATTLLLALVTIASSSGCVRYKLISGDKNPVRVEAGKPFTPATDGWFVTDPWMQENEEALSLKILELETLSRH